MLLVLLTLAFLWRSSLASISEFKEPVPLSLIRMDQMLNMADWLECLIGLAITQAQNQQRRKRLQSLHVSQYFNNPARRVRRL
jgi:hypothetical protein